MSYIYLQADRIDRDAVNKVAKDMDLPRDWVDMVHRFQWKRVVEGVKTANCVEVTGFFMLDVGEKVRDRALKKMDRLIDYEQDKLKTAEGEESIRYIENKIAELQEEKAAKEAKTATKLKKRRKS